MTFSEILPKRVRIRQFHSKNSQYIKGNRLRARIREFMLDDMCLPQEQCQLFLKALERHKRSYAYLYDSVYEKNGIIAVMEFITPRIHKKEMGKITDLCKEIVFS